VYNDFPANWAELPGIVSNYLSSNTKDGILGGLFCLNEISSVYEFIIDFERRPLHNLVETYEEKVRLLLTNAVFMYCDPK